MSDYKKTTDQNAKARLKELQESLSDWTQIQLTLESEVKRLEEKKLTLSSAIEPRLTELKMLQGQQQLLLQNLNAEEAVYKNNINNLKQSLERSLSKSQNHLNAILNSESQESEKALSEIEESLLKQLRQKIVAEFPEFKDDLESFLKRESSSLLSMRERPLILDCESLKTYLKKELTRINMCYEDFEAKANKIIIENYQ